MKKEEPVIKNKSGEKLDTWVETPEGVVKANVIMVHGFGTNKGETAGYFDDISKALVSDNFRVIRFDFSGYGKSEGRQEDVCYSKQVDDLRSVWQLVTASYHEPVHIFAQSMGCWVTSITSIDGIGKTLMTGIPNADPQLTIDRIAERFGKRAGAKLDFNGISELPRSTGEIQKIGPKFWQEIKNLDPVVSVANYSEKTDLLIIHWLEDEIIGSETLELYDAIPTVKSKWLHGNHSVSNPDDRKNFTKVMLDFYNN
jgi:hypothetical protein